MSALPRRMVRRLRLWFAYLGLGALLCWSPGAAADEDFFALGQRPNHYLLLRHALAPGVGDPPRLRLADCSTQRNLSAEGRAQARGIGETLRAAGVAGAEVLSSQWCRCLDTARLLELGPVRAFAPLNSFFGQPERAAPQLAELRGFLATHVWQGPTVLVTHQVVITGLTGVYPASGEALVIARQAEDRWSVVARREF